MSKETCVFTDARGMRPRYLSKSKKPLCVAPTYEKIKQCCMETGCSYLCQQRGGSVLNIYRKLSLGSTGEYDPRKEALSTLVDIIINDPGETLLLPPNTKL